MNFNKKKVITFQKVQVVGNKGIEMLYGHIMSDKIRNEINQN